MSENLPTLESSNAELVRAFEIALEDLLSNVKPFKDGLLESSKRCILAGKGYDTPWTRDTAINTWNGAGLLIPEIAKNTLLSVLTKSDEGNIVIGGQYWDAIIWVIGAWEYFRYTGDNEFIRQAEEAALNSITYFEAAEFDPTYGLFKGPACYGDGVAAYPDDCLGHKGRSVYIYKDQEHSYETRPKSGAGINFFSLSTNCLYHQVYKLLPELQKAASGTRPPGSAQNRDWFNKAEKLKGSIQKHFWDSSAGMFRYVVHSRGASLHQEGLGNAFAILFGVANDEQARSILEKQHVTPAGVPCVWPTFSRYAKTDKHYGRHSGTVWPHIQGFWAEAALRKGRPDLFWHELSCLAKFANRDGQFVEIYHPDTGESYGGLQELNPEFLDNPYFKDFKDAKVVGYEDTTIRLFKSCERQTWSATAYVRLILKGIFGLEFELEGLCLKPFLPKQMNQLKIKNLIVRGCQLQIELAGTGQRILDYTFNGKSVQSPFIAYKNFGPSNCLKIRLAD